MTEATSEMRLERVDELPILLYWLEQLQVAQSIDEALPQPHGDRRGLSYGQLSVLFVAYMLNQSDHRLCAVEEWVECHQSVLEQATGWQIGAKDATDDRLGTVVELLGEQEEARIGIEQQLGHRTISAYSLPTEVGRCDTSSFSVYHQREESEEGETLLRFGHSKDHRPDLRQYRQALGTLDPSGIPLVSTTLAGNGADDSVYVPIWQQMQAVIGHKDFIFIADCKASAHQTRAYLDKDGGLYCVPLAATGQVPAMLKSWVLDPFTVLEEFYLPDSEGEQSAIGRGFERELGQRWVDPETGKIHYWMERYLVVQSDQQAHRQHKNLERRLTQAEQALEQLTRRKQADCCRLQSQVEAILKRYRVQNLVRYEIHYDPLMRYRKRGRPKAGESNGQWLEERFTLSFERHPTAIEEAQQLCGWRIYVTNTSPQRLNRSQAIAYYRDQWTLERCYHRCKRGALPALPMFLQSDERIIGLMFLLTIALRVLTLIEFVVRRQLEQSDTPLAGLYAGNPKRTTWRPSTESLLNAFANITLAVFPARQPFLSPLTALQHRILSLMGIPPDIYQRLLNLPTQPILISSA